MRRVRTMSFVILFFFFYDVNAGRDNNNIFSLKRAKARSNKIKFISIKSQNIISPVVQTINV